MLFDSDLKERVVSMLFDSDLKELGRSTYNISSLSNVAQVKMVLYCYVSTARHRCIWSVSTRVRTEPAGMDFRRQLADEDVGARHGL